MAIPRTTWTDDSGTPSNPAGDGTVLNNAALQAVYDAIESWDVDSYTPSWTSSGSAPAIGNGTIVGKYIALGDVVFFRITMTFGNTTTFGTGNYSLSLPLTGLIGSGNVQASAVDSSAGGAVFGGEPYVVTTTTILLGSRDTAGTTGAFSAWTPTAPISFDDPDVIYVSGMYFRA